MIANNSEICKDGFRNSRGIQTIQTALVPCAAGRESALRAVSLAQKALRGLNLELGRPAGRKGPPFTSPRCHRGSRPPLVLVPPRYLYREATHMCGSFFFLCAWSTA